MSFPSLNTLVCDMQNTITSASDSDRIQVIKEIQVKHSLVHAWARLLIDWEHQVSNGGHQQYVDNNYHSTQCGSCDCDTHNKLVSLTESIKGTIEFPQYEELLTILKAFKVERYSGDQEEVCNECDGSGYVEDEDGMQGETCEECNGRCYVTVDRSDELSDCCISNLELLDSRYYKISTELLSNIDEAVTEWLGNRVG